ncbi:MAG: hypothetical protein E3J35_03670 [Methanomassiliicoccales archaeon]|nr:MAG: hypothetical protein E3J35_03670 [Methanomassiliicoccales archaeon]
MIWIRKISPADLLTIGNGVLGFLAITYIFDGKLQFAYALLILAITLDGLDGIVARKFGTKHTFGPYLDLSSDTISFCFAPAILLYSTFYDIAKGSALVSVDNALAVIVPAFVIVAGILHLARNASQQSPVSHFIGLPTATTAFFIVALCLLIGENGLLWHKLQHPFLLIATLTSVLAISEIGYPKVEGKLVPWAGMALSSLMLASLLGLWNVEPLIGIVLASLSLSIGVLYLIAGPFLFPRNKDIGDVSMGTRHSDKS